MKRKNATRNALFTSIISLLLCVSMLVGTTFAWFTDSVVSGNNVIAAGNLDIELYNDGNKVTSSTNLFENVLWEPGVAIYENFTIKNEGNLALLYDFAINWGDYNTLAGQYNLTQILKVAMVDGHVSGNREAVIAKGEGKWAALDTWSFSGEMTKKGDTKDFALIIYWEPSDNDNNWNVQNGKTLDKGDHLYVNLGINLQATQKMHESDSFGPDYDSLANAWDGSIGKVPAEKDGVITLTTGAELAAFAAAVNGGTSFSGKTVVLGADINLGNQPWTAIGDCESGKYFRGTFDGQGHTIYNLSVDYSNDPSEHATAGLFGWVDAAGATVKNVKLENATVLGSHWVGGIAGYWTGRIENCSVSNSTIMGFNVNDDANGDKVGGIVGHLNEHSYINNNTVIGCDITGNREVGGIAGAVAKTTYQMNNNTVTNTTLCYSEERDYASAGKIVSGRTGYVANDTNVATDDVTIVRVINVKTVAELNAALAALSGDALNTAAILQNCNEPDGVVKIPANYTGTLTLKDSSIASVQAGNAANLVIAGTVKVENAEGSAITGIELNISGNGNLTAIANDSVNDKTHYYGIGGDQTTKIDIENVHIVDVKGGFVQPAVTGNWGKVNEEGGAAIGSGTNGAMITLNNVTIDNAQGGGKAAGIGANYWTGVTVNIHNSTIKNVEGGATAAGIGGSRVSNGATTAESVTVNITNSNVTAIGGDYGAGIGSGYSTYLHGESTDRPLYTINIDENSVINATGGVAAAGIGTGHNVVGLTGEIKSQNVTAKAGSATCPAPNVACCGGRVRTDAQDIGFGSLADEVFANPITKTITYLGNEIQIPALPIASSESLDEAIKEGKTVLTLAAGTYTIPESAKGKTLTINGTKDVIIQVQDQSGPNSSDGSGQDYGFDGSTVTFNGVTIDTTAQSGQYRGFARLSAVYNDCAFKGTYTLGTGTSEFNNCTFDLQNNYVWTWGASMVTFNKCTFEDSQGYAKAILVHNTVATAITVKDCTFIATTAANTWDGIPVAAVSIDPNAKETVSIAFEGTNTYSDAFNGLYQLKYAPETYLIKATVDGETVTVPAMKETHP